VKSANLIYIRLQGLEEGGLKKQNSKSIARAGGINQLWFKKKMWLLVGPKGMPRFFETGGACLMKGRRVDIERSKHIEKKKKGHSKGGEGTKEARGNRGVFKGQHPAQKKRMRRGSNAKPW